MSFFKNLERYRVVARLREAQSAVPELAYTKRHLGVMLTLIGMFLLALYTVLFELKVHRFSLQISSSLAQTFFGFAILFFSMFFTFAIFALPRGFAYFKSKRPKLLLSRTAFAIISFWAYSLARVWSTTVDNSMLFSTDAIWVIAILYILGIKLKKTTLFGVFLGFLSIIYVCVISFTTYYDLLGWLFGSISGLTLGVITVITSYLVRYDPPLRIGLYLAFFGFISSIIMAIFFGMIQGWEIPRFPEMLHMLLTGIYFGFALFCVWESFYYAEAYVIGAATYFFPVFIVGLNWIINEETVNTHTLIATLLVATGSLIVLISPFTKKNRKHEIL